MSTYLPDAEFEQMLRTGHGFDAGERVDFITRGSAMVDGELAHVYWTPFIDYVVGVSSPPMPVRLAAGRFALWLAMDAGLIQNRVDSDTESRSFYEDARKILEPYRDEKSGQAFQQLAPETVTEQFYAGSAWGDGDPYSSNQIALSVTRGEVILESVRVLTSAGAVTDYVLGSDFYVTYNAGTRKWVFNRGDSNICSQAAAVGDDPAVDGDKVQYEVTRLKRREIVQAKMHSIDIIRG